MPDSYRDVGSAQDDTCGRHKPFVRSVRTAAPRPRRTPSRRRRARAAHLPLLTRRMPTRRDMPMTAFSTDSRSRVPSATVRNDRHAASRRRQPAGSTSAMPTVPRSAMIVPGKPAASSCCGSRISTRRARGPSSSTAFSRTCAGSASTGTEPVIVQSQRTAAYSEALERLRARGPGLRLLLHPGRYRPVADRAAR